MASTGGLLPITTIVVGSVRTPLESSITLTCVQVSVAVLRRVLDVVLVRGIMVVVIV